MARRAAAYTVAEQAGEEHPCDRRSQRSLCQHAAAAPAGPDVVGTGARRPGEGMI